MWHDGVRTIVPLWRHDEGNEGLHRSWVEMWRPLEVLLYDRWPLIDERRLVRRILDAPVSIR